MSDKNPVSEKNTKSEILKAYEELLARVKESSQPSKKAEKDLQERKEIIKTAAGLSSGNIISALSSLKLDIMKSLDQVSEQLMDKQKTFSALENAIDIETKNLQELDKLIKEHMRENEEYQYKLKFERQQDADQYELKKQALEKSCEEREANLNARETELEDLRTKVSSCHEKLDSSLKNCEEQITTKLTTQFQHEVNLRSKEYEGELRLFKQTIATLEDKVKEKDALIEQLTQKSNQATLQIQDIAVKAIEGASASRAFSGMFAQKIESEKVNKV